MREKVSTSRDIRVTEVSLKCRLAVMVPRVLLLARSRFGFQPSDVHTTLWLS